MGLFFGILEFSRKFARLGNFDAFEEKCDKFKCDLAPESSSV